MSMDPSTVYVNPYFIVNHYKETALASKHYYMGSQRLASAMIDYWPYGIYDEEGEVGEGDEGGSSGESSGHYSNPNVDGALINLQNTMNCLSSSGTVNLDWEQLLPLYSLQEYPVEFITCMETIILDGEGEEEDIEVVEPLCFCEQSLYWANQNEHNCDELNILYFYHPDYLGSIEFVTDMRGDPYQFFLNTPFGENLENQMAYQYKGFSSRFRFNAKEWDPETGNYYYGARYYDPKVSVWLSLDAMASKGPYITPYAFSHNNPVMLVDPDGNWPNLASLSSWYTSVFNSAAKQTAQHRFNEMKDRTAAARGYSRNIRLASDQSFSVTGSSMRSKIQLADGRAFDQVKGSAGYNILGSKGTTRFYGHRKNSLKLYDVTTIDWNPGREGRGVSGGGMGGYGFEVTLKNSNNTVASMYLGEQEYNDLFNNYNSAVDNQFNELLESRPMVKDYYNNVFSAESKMREFWSNTSDWTPEARNTYQQLTQEYNQALHDFNERWNQ